MNLSTNIDFDIKRFFLWWGRELAFWVPEKLRQALSDKSGYVFLTVIGETLQITRMTEEDKQTVAELAITEQGLAQYQTLMDENTDLEKAHCILRLTSEQAIKKILYLPVAAKENLNQVVAFELDRYTPFKTEQVYFSVKQLSKETNGQIKVLLVVTPKTTLDSICLELNNAGIYPAVVEYEQAANDFEQDLEIYNLLPEQIRPRKDRVTQILTWLFAGIALLLSIAVLVYPVWHEGQTVKSLKQQLKGLTKDASLVQSRQLEIDDIVDETTRLIKTKNSTPSMTELINTLSKLIPDDTWVTHFRYNEARLQIQGQSPVASTLIGILEASSLFSNARFVSPLTQDKRTGLERFQISVDIKVQGDDDDE